ncbi:MAG: AAC(3) family N-acetyltransferase [Candidatus Dormibacteria bacterium]
MTEEASVHPGAAPHTRASLAADLAILGLPPAGVVLVHSSLSRLGWVAGGAQAVVLALLDAVGPGGTMVVPTHSTHLSDPARWSSPPVPESWWPVIREQTPAYDPALTPTRKMGAIVEVFRHLPGVVRSNHPTSSFAALGPHAADIVSDHELTDALGEHSPLARVYDHDGRVLLLGVGHGNNTSLHLSENRAAFAGKKTCMQGAPVIVDGVRRWVEFEEFDPDDRDFEDLGAAFAATGQETEGPVGAGVARLMRQRELVDFGVTWIEEHRR